MKSIHKAGIQGILFIFLMVNPAWGQAAEHEGLSSSQNAKQGTAREENGKEIGAVIDFIVELATGRILFAVVSPEPSDEEGTSVLLLPWNLAQVDVTGNNFDFRIADRTLQGAPRLSLKVWEGKLPLHVLTRAEKYWNGRSTQLSPLTLGKDVSLCKATALIGVAVQGTESDALGTIRELVFDTDDNAIALVVLTRPEATEHSASEFMSLSWKQLYIEPRGNSVIAFAGNKTLT